MKSKVHKLVRLFNKSEIGVCTMSDDAMDALCRARSDLVCEIANTPSVTAKDVVAKLRFLADGIEGGYGDERYDAGWDLHQSVISDLTDLINREELEQAVAGAQYVAAQRVLAAEAAKGGA